MSSPFALVPDFADRNLAIQALLGLHSVGDLVRGVAYRGDDTPLPNAYPHPDYFESVMLALLSLADTLDRSLELQVPDSAPSSPVAHDLDGDLFR